MQPVPHASGLPRAQPPPGGVPGPVSQLEREVPPAAAGVQHEQDAFQRGPLVDPRPPARPLRRRPRREQRFDQLPESVFDQPLLLRPRHDRARSLITTRRSRTDTPGSETTSYLGLTRLALPIPAGSYLVSRPPGLPAEPGSAWHHRGRQQHCRTSAPGTARRCSGPVHARRPGRSASRTRRAGASARRPCDPAPTVHRPTTTSTAAATPVTRSDTRC